MPPGRGDEILDAALDLLRKGGLAAVTTAALAREARCSKDTLYQLFENREAILAALVARQAAALNAALRNADPDRPPLEGLIEAGAQLLKLLTSEASLAINRAALADPSGSLSRILIEAGKAHSAPMILALIARLRDAGTIVAPDPADTYRSFYGLLISDRQILALHGVREPAPEDCREIARRAVARFVRIYAPEGPTP